MQAFYAQVVIYQPLNEAFTYALETVTDDYMRKVDINFLYTKIHKNFQINIQTLGVTPELISR